jgi:2-polyprenyl-3-methyl-5-hydroxy-6-metoxy-1,4-benzoquinol methylase
MMHLKILTPENLIEVMDFTAIDDFLSRLDQAVDDDHLRRIFTEYSAEYELNTPSDPFSQEYLEFQMRLYRQLALKEYLNLNEITNFDVAEMVRSPFPYCHQSFETVGDTLLAIGYLIKKMALPKGATILEFGPGWGNTSVELAKTGYLVTAVDIEENFVYLINQRAEKEGLKNLKAIHGDFFDIDNFNEKFDVVLFFESFHHCSDHNLLLSKIDRVLKPGGKIVFGAEPITSDFPIPWGLRMDGQSLWAIRKNGWLELGFNRKYFTAALNKLKYVIEYFDGKDGSWSQVAIARRVDESTRIFTPGMGQLRTQIGQITPIGIQGGSESGFLIYGPYCELVAGRYEVLVYITLADLNDIPVEIDVVSGAGQTTHAGSKFKVTKERELYNIKFSLSDSIQDFEIRVMVNKDSSSLILTKVEIRSIL